MALKNFYTQGELKKLSNEELMELTTFGGGDSTYYYADLDRIQSEMDGNTPEYSFHFKDKSAIYTQEESTYNEVKIGKARYDMLSKSLEQHKSDEEMMQNFFENVTKMVQDKVEFMAAEGLKTQENIRGNVENMTSNATREITNTAATAIKTVEDFDKSNKKVIKDMTGKLDSVSKKWDAQLAELKTLDLDAYNIRMEKVEEIIKAFDKLLED